MDDDGGSVFKSTEFIDGVVFFFWWCPSRPGGEKNRENKGTK